MLNSSTSPSQDGLVSHFTDHCSGRLMCRQVRSRSSDIHVMYKSQVHFLFSFSRFAGEINKDGSDFDLYAKAYYLIYGGGDTTGSELTSES